MANSMKVHPAADSFRLMRQEELQGLAEDIAANGLIDPIVLGRINGAATEMLVDGRNRLKACEMAGVEPRFETIEFEDDEAVRAYVKSRGQHRDLSKGERAMAHALLYPEPGKRGRGNRAKSLVSGDFSQQRLSEARAVLRHSRELALAVRDGTVKLDAALEQIKAERAQVGTAESQLARLRAEAPDLAELVDEERLPLGEAFASFKKRQEDERLAEESRRETIVRVTTAAYSGLAAWASDEFAATAMARCEDPRFCEELRSRLRLGTEPVGNLSAALKSMQKLLLKIESKVS